jgi:subtilase family serine protease
VEATSNSNADLYQAVDVAGNIVAQAGYGEVSMSWGGTEFSGEASYDSHFATPGVVYFASSGDTGGKTIYPGVSPNVVSAGGTSVLRSNGLFVSEAGWSGSGGGPSQYEYRPAYQDVVSSIVGMKRGVPDFSFDADPNTGVSVYDSTMCQGVAGWLIFGGTSVASPSLAGIVNLANSRYPSTAQELTAVYGSAPPSGFYGQNFRDITSGSAGTYKTKAGWDFVTGLGSNIGLSGK